MAAVMQREKEIRNLLTPQIEQVIMRSYAEILIHGESVIDLDKDINHVRRTDQFTI